MWSSLVLLAVIVKESQAVIGDDGELHNKQLEDTLVS